MYYNTTNQEGEVLKEYKIKAISQEKEILEFMSRYGLPYSASEITEILFISRNVPITSVRRGLTNLYADGKIKKVGKVKGMYGRPENTYQIIENQLNLF